LPVSSNVAASMSGDRYRSLRMGCVLLRWEVCEVDALV
jgi:hypothetical protein